MSTSDVVIILGVTLFVIIGGIFFFNRKKWLGVRNFNYRHPETQKGEICITNSDIDCYEKIPWKTKRKGEVAYDIYGKPITTGRCFPVFVQKSELEKAGINPEKIKRKRIKLYRI